MSYAHEWIEEVTPLLLGMDPQRRVPEWLEERPDKTPLIEIRIAMNEEEVVPVTFDLRRADEGIAEVRQAEEPRAIARLSMQTLDALRARELGVRAAYAEKLVETSGSLHLLDHLHELLYVRPEGA